jgi:hypothetical protein
MHWPAAPGGDDPLFWDDALATSVVAKTLAPTSEGTGVA